MKARQLMTLAATLLLPFTGSCEVVEKEDCTPELLKEVLHDRHGELIVHFSPGDEIAVKLKADGLLVELDETAPVIARIGREVFVRFSNADGIKVSLDGSEWSDFTDLFGGTVSFTLSSEAGMQAVSLGLTVDVK